MDARHLLPLLVLAFMNSAIAQDDDAVESIDGCDLASLEGYNLGLAIASIFIIFAVSFAGAILPVSLAFSSHPLLVKAVKTLAYAGAGVLLATGFLHLLLPAQEALTSECLSESFLGSYPSYAFLFCVISIACMQVLDYFVTVKIAKKSPPSLAGAEELNQREEEIAATAVGSSTTGACKEDMEAGACVVHTVCKDSDCAGQTLLYSNKSTTSKAQIYAVLLSEASISVHSVLIGIILGIATGDEIVPLLIALIFHQFVEGVVIGTASFYAGMKIRSVALLAVIYALTTPVGIAIGIGIRYSYNENSPSALLTQGILDAICGGMLIFLALGDHINAMKNQSHWLKEEGTVTHVACIGAFLIGVAVMCILAVWV